MIGTIKLNNNTKSHAANLRALGYEVTEGDGILRVEVTGFINFLDLTGAEGIGAFRDVITAKAALTYSTKIVFPEGVFQSLPACLKLAALSKKAGLPNLSCLVMRGEVKASTRAAPIDIAAWLRG